MANGGIGCKCVILVCILVIIILLCENGKLNMENKIESPDLNPQEFEQLLKEKKVVFVKFYAPWCPHCTKLTGTMDELATKYGDNPQVGIVKVNVDKYKEVGDKYQVRGFPTLQLFKNGAKVEDYQGTRDVKSFKKFIDAHI